MSKILTIPNSLDEINKLICDVDGFIIGITGMCVNVNYCIDIKNVSILNNISNKDIFISLNKNMHNNDLSKIRNILLKLNNYGIKGVLYYDVAVLNIYNSMDLNYDLVWSAEHLVTNYNTINYWHDFNVNYAYLSNDITEDEMVTISKNCKTKLMVNLFGYLPMFVSKRHIIKNYLEYFNLKDNSKINYIKKENKSYPIIDNEVGTYVYSNNILNGIKTYLNIDVQYVVLNSFGINLEDFVEIIKMFKTVNESNALSYDKRINNMFLNVDNGFLSTKTVYKVKKNEK